jgi:hypothetical protein
MLPIIAKIGQFVNTFFNLSMPNTALSIIDLQTLLSKNPTRNEIIEKFRLFEIKLKEEFPYHDKGAFKGFDQHRFDCFRLFYELSGQAITKNMSAFEQVALLQSDEILERRKIALKNWGTLLSFGNMKDASNDQKTVIMSFLYLAKFEGFFEEDIKICYSWLQLAEQKQVTMKDLENMKIGTIQNYFKSNNLPMFLFEGWNHHLRNSIAHLSFRYIPDEQTIEYEDKPASWIQKFTINEILALNQKLVNVNQMVTVIYSLIIIRNLCDPYKNTL